MKKGILGRKIGMTQVFRTNGEVVPVTVIEVEPNVVTQIKTKDNDGYEAIQLGFSTKREKLATKASVGITNKAKTTPKRFFKEIKVGTLYIFKNRVNSAVLIFTFNNYARHALKICKYCGSQSAFTCDQFVIVAVINLPA